MKRLLVLVLVFIIQVFCSKYTFINKQFSDTNDCAVNIICVNHGQSCDNVNTYCNQGQYCDKGSKICYKMLKNGEQCISHDQCLSSYCNSANKCQDETFASVGQSCAENFCMEEAHCGINNTCQLLPTGGEACDWQCMNGFTCQKSVCVEQFTLDVGAVCYSGALCQPGLFCNSSFQCDTAFSGSKKPCNTNDDCLPKEQCLCSGSTNTATKECTGPETFDPKIVSSLKDYYSCQRENMCTTQNKNGILETCHACQHAFCSYYTEANEEQMKNYPKCKFETIVLDTLDHCKKTRRSWLAGIITAVVLVVVISVSALIIVIRKKGNIKSFLPSSHSRELQNLVGK